MRLTNPLWVNWLFTLKCPFNCKHCYVQHLKLFAGKEDYDVESLAREILSLRPVRVTLTGGEPVITDKLWRIIDILSNAVPMIDIVTSGIDRKEDVKRLIEYNVYFFVSLDGARRETHEALRGSGSWVRVMRTLELLRKYDARFATITSIWSGNIGELGEIIELAQRYGAETACFIPVMRSGRALEEKVYVDAKGIYEALREIDVVADILAFPVRLWCMPFAPLIVKSKYVYSSACRDPTRVPEVFNIDILFDRWRLLCDVIGAPLSRLERPLHIAIAKHNLGEDVARFRQPVKAEPCTTCPVYSECLGGCPARALMSYGTPVLPDPLCPRVQGVIK